MKDRLKGSILLFIGAIIWGLAFVAQDKASSIIAPFTLNATRCICAFIFLFLIILALSIKNKKPILEADTKDRKNLFTAGVLCGCFLCVAVNLQQFGISAYPDSAAASGRAGFITALYVIVVPIISLFFKKKIGLNVLISVLLATIGMYLLCFGKGIEHLYLGDLIVFLCAVAFSFQIMCVDKYANLVDGIKLSALQFLVCGILSTILMFIFETPSIKEIINAVGPILYLGIMSSGIGYTLQIIGQKYSKNPSLDSVIMSFESVFAAIGGAIIMSEVLSPKEIIGCSIMFIAIIIAQVPIRKKYKDFEYIKSFKNK